jgi:hypothetical protein
MNVFPLEVSLGIGQIQTFNVSVVGLSTNAVDWTIQEGASGGSITDQGVYTAPQNLGTFHVVATSRANATISAHATIDVVPITVSVSPESDTLGLSGVRAFSATVVGTNQAVTWSVQEGASGGSISSVGVYTAPQTQGTFHVVATSQADTSATKTAAVNVVPSGFRATGEMSTPRAGHTATLVNGKVLIVGGCNEDYQSGCLPFWNGPVELFDPNTEAFTATGSLETARASHTATLLSNGKVLIAGGYTLNGGATTSAELYDPAQGAFTTTGSMSTARFGHVATALGPTNGKVLITGGTNFGTTLASAELYDPATGTFTPTGNMQKARTGHSATLLADGKVLIAGGYGPNCAGCPDNTAELYDPATGVFTQTGDMPGPIALHSAVLLTSGLVLIAGGDFCGVTGAGGGSECAAEDGTNQALLYDSTTGSFKLTGAMAFARISHSATLLFSGKVLIAGGTGADTPTGLTFSVELYDPATGLFSRTGSMASARTLHTATLLGNGTVLVVGGDETLFDDSPLTSAEIYK